PRIDRQADYRKPASQTASNRRAQGYQDANGVPHGFLDSNGVYTTIDYPDSVETGLDEINSKSQIIGSFSEDGGGAQPFLVGRQRLSDRMTLLRKRGILAHRSPDEEQR